MLSIVENKRLMNKKEYSEYLKNPKWQKKRLEILSRDNFSCVVCGKGIETDTALHVHHLSYRKGCMPWEYDNSNFVTLCEQCHSDVHNKKLKLCAPKNKKTKTDNKTRYVFYRKLLSDPKLEMLTPNQKIVYSYAISKSIIKITDLFNKDGEGIDTSLLDFAEGKNNVISLEFELKNWSKLANDLGISRRSMTDIKTSLSSYGFVTDNRVYFDKDILSSGYFRLICGCGLSKMLLILYSWLYEKSKSFDFTIDTYEWHIAKQFNISLSNIENMMSRLSQKRYVTRLFNSDGSYGKLKINRINTI